MSKAPNASELRGTSDRAVDAEGDPQVGRRRAAEDGQGERRADGANPALEVALVLLLGIDDPAQRAAQVDPDPLRARRPTLARHELRVGERHLAGGQPELAEPIELAGSLGLHVVERLEVVDLGRDLRAERARVEAVDSLDRRAAGPKAGPERRQPGPDGGDQADPGDPHPARRVGTGALDGCHVLGYVPAT